MAGAERGTEINAPCQLCARHEELAGDGPYARRRTRLIAAPRTRQAGQKQVRSCRASERNLEFDTEGCEVCEKMGRMWTPETPRV